MNNTHVNPLIAQALAPFAPTSRTIDDVKSDLFAAMQTAEIARSERRAAELRVPEWAAERAAVAEVSRLYAEFSSFPDSERKRVLGMGAGMIG